MPRHTPAILGFYQRFLRTRDSARFTHAVVSAYTLPTLERLMSAAGAETRRAAILAIGHLGDYASNQAIGRALRDQDRGVRLIAEGYCQQIWESAGNMTLRRTLRVADRLETCGRYTEALQLAEQVRDAEPSYAEAWRHCGNCFYGLNDCSSAAGHFRRTLHLNPFQFEAAIALAQCYLDVDKPLVAYRWLKRALQINPGLEQIRLEATRLLRSSRRE